MRRRLSIWLAAAILTALPVREARAQLFGFPAQEVTQLLNHAQLVMTYIKEAQIALQAIQMAQIMAREGLNLAKAPKTNITADLSTLSAILVQSQGLAGDMARMDATFRSVYAPYTPTPITNYANSYNAWSATSLNTIHGMLAAAGMQGNMLLNEQLWMAQIDAMNQTPLGRDQALQLGNQIGTQEVAQLQKLRELMIADMSSKAAVTAQQVNAQQQQQAAQQNSFAHASWAADGRTW